MDVRIYHEDATGDLAAAFFDRGKMLMFWPMKGKTDAEARQIAADWLEKEKAKIKGKPVVAPTDEELRSSVSTVTHVELRNLLNTPEAVAVAEHEAIVPEKPYVTTTERRQAIDDGIAEAIARRNKAPTVVVKSGPATLDFRAEPAIKSPWEQ